MNMNQRVIYIAGPYRGPDAWTVESNIRRAEATALEVWRAGHVALCPHAMTRYYQGVLPDDAFLLGDLELLGRCDAVLVLHDSEGSRGTQAEIEHARTIGVPVHYQPARGSLPPGLFSATPPSLADDFMSAVEAGELDRAGAMLDVMGPDAEEYGPSAGYALVDGVWRVCLGYRVDGEFLCTGCSGSGSPVPLEAGTPQLTCARCGETI